MKYFMPAVTRLFHAPHVTVHNTVWGDCERIGENG